MIQDRSMLDIYYNDDDWKSYVVCHSVLNFLKGFFSSFNCVFFFRMVGG